MKNARKSVLLTTMFLVTGAAALAGCAKAQTGSTCGDGIRQLYEECEGTNLAGQSCASLGLGAGTLACSSDCTFDTHACSAQGRCGDGVRQPGEQCDGADLGGASCATLNLGSGTLACSAVCQYDSTGCSSQAQCGNGVVEGSEDCDGMNFGGKTCQSLGQGFSGGTLTCTTSCTLDTSNCTQNAACNNGVIEAGEQCDGTQFGGATCQTFGYAGGQLRCTPTCTIDKSGCNDQAEICDNGIDDDGDNAIDCNDIDCSSNSACNGSPENCTNGIDDDNDGQTDCDDVDCNGNSACASSGEEICDNGTDDDGNFLCDCMDILACLLDPACLLADSSETSCTDNQDNDGDCLIDCDDPDCDSDVACGATPEDCTNGIDDDNDGQTDCGDSDCAQDEACNQTEDCSNGVDDDHDGQTDCDDPDCDGTTSCPTCMVAGTLDCGGQITGTNSDGRAHIDSYDCASYSDTGPEVVYTVTPAQDGTMHVTLHADSGADLDLIVAGQSTSDCDPTNCAASQNAPGTDETLDIAVTQGVTYYIIVDGYSGATDSFTLSVTCD